MSNGLHPLGIKGMLAVLEYLNTPRPKKGYGVFNQGWERPANVFMAAKTLDKQMKQQVESQQRNVRSDVEQETLAQAQARERQMLKDTKIWIIQRWMLKDFVFVFFMCLLRRILA
ncbi:hypothetical protein Tco_0214344 [Tanacetum coccineum]